MPGYELGRLRVLVIEDSETMQRLLRTVLKSLGVGKVIMAGDGSAALEVVRTRTVHLAIADLAMKPMDGITFLRVLRRDPDRIHSMLPVILMTAHSERHLIEAAREAGVNEAMAKPISAQALWQRIEAVIERPRLFIRGDSYIGPDRRRRQDPGYGGPERRSQAAPRQAGGQTADSADEWRV